MRGSVVTELSRRLTRHLVHRPVPGPVPSMAVVLAAWDAERTARCLAALGSQRSPARDVLVVLNRAGARPAGTTGGASFLEGSNTDAEFSAYDEGIAWHRSRGGAPDVWLLVNDRMLSYDQEHQHLLDPAVQGLVRDEGAAVGWLDRLPRPARALGHRVDVYCRSNYVLVAGALLDRLGPVTTVRREAWEGLASTSEPASVEGLSSDYLRFLWQWHTGADLDALGGWYRSGDPAATTWANLRGKFQSVVNEHLLSARMQHERAPLLSPKQAAVLARAHPLSRVRRRVLQTARTDAATALRSSRPGLGQLVLAVRVATRGGELPGARHRRASAWS